jgi:hypothetical protein
VNINSGTNFLRLQATLTTCAADPLFHETLVFVMRIVGISRTTMPLDYILRQKSALHPDHLLLNFQLVEDNFLCKVFTCTQNAE